MSQKTKFIAIRSLFRTFALIKIRYGTRDKDNTYFKRRKRGSFLDNAEKVEKGAKKDFSKQVAIARKILDKTL